MYGTSHLSRGILRAFDDCGRICVRICANPHVSVTFLFVRTLITPLYFPYINTYTYIGH